MSANAELPNSNAAQTPSQETAPKGPQLSDLKKMLEKKVAASEESGQIDPIPTLSDSQLQVARESLENSFAQTGIHSSAVSATPEASYPASTNYPPHLGVPNPYGFAAPAGYVPTAQASNFNQPIQPVYADPNSMGFAAETQALNNLAYGNQTSPNSGGFGFANQSFDFNQPAALNSSLVPPQVESFGALKPTATFNPYNAEAQNEQNPFTGFSVPDPLIFKSEQPQVAQPSFDHIQNPESTQAPNQVLPQAGFKPQPISYDEWVQETNPQTNNSNAAPLPLIRPAEPIVNAVTDYHRVVLSPWVSENGNNVQQARTQLEQNYNTQTATSSGEQIAEQKKVETAPVVNPAPLTPTAETSKTAEAPIKNDIISFKRSFLERIISPNVKSGDPSKIEAYAKSLVNTSS